MRELTKFGSGECGLSVERRKMQEALARLGEVGTRLTPTVTRTGRLVFALDLTGSREHSLRQARVATAAMFDAVKAIGRVEVKLIYYRGTDTCRETQWQYDPALLRSYMEGLTCESGETQIARVLRSALAEAGHISGLVFVGDHCEEDCDELLALASDLGQRSTPLWIFHECADGNQRSLTAKPVFKRMAKVSGGIYVEFRPDSGEALRELLSSVAAFSAAGAEGVRQMALPETTEGRQAHERLLLGRGHPGATNGSERR